MDLFELVGKITIDNADANKQLDDTSKKGKDTESKLGKAFQSVGKGAVAVGKTVGVGLAAAGTAMGGLTIKALNLSGELEQNMGGSEQVFKEYAGSMQETARDAFANMGLSTSEYLGTANKMGALFQGAGFSIEESMNLSSGAMQRAADVASIMGIDTSAAMEAIAGAAKGNFTMMDNLGVAMNDTTLQAYALEKGINKSTTEMTNQEKIGLAMEMFMEKTAYAAGNYARENETLAGSLGTAKSALTNFLDGSGNADQLVTAFSNAANVIVDNVTQIAPRLITGLTEVVNQIIPMIPELMNSLLPVIVEGAVTLINGLVAAMPDIITALMNILPSLIDGFTQIINALIEAMPMMVESIVAALPTLIPALIDGLVSMIVTLCTNFAQIIQPIIDHLPEIITSISSALLENLPALLEGIGTLITGVVTALPELCKGILDALDDVITGLVDSLLTWAEPIIANIATWWDGVKTDLIAKWEEIKTSVSTAVTEMWTNITTTFSNLWTDISGTVTNIWDGVTSKFTEIKTNVTDTVTGLWTSVKGVFSDLWSDVKSTWDNIKSAIQTPIESARDLVDNAISTIRGLFDFEFKWPKIPMPHFSISGTMNPIKWFEEGTPKLSVEWYAKGAIMKQPTLFDYNPATGAARVGGEAGAEAVAPIDTLQQYIRAAVQAENTMMAELLQRIINLLVQFFPDALEAMRTPMVCDTNGLAIAMAPAMDAQLGKIAFQKGRGR